MENKVILSTERNKTEQQRKYGNIEITKITLRLDSGTQFSPFSSFTAQFFHTHRKCSKPPHRALSWSPQSTNSHHPS
uniref:Uncharacterized protein n=1 Tax=Cucumis melo TaxID=3656 RepID=A0A9I9EEH7_CUCME